VIYLLNKRYGISKKKKKEAISIPIKNNDDEKQQQQQPIAEESSAMCYGSLMIPWEEWFDKRLVDFGTNEWEENSREETTTHNNDDDDDNPTPPFFSVTPHLTLDIIKMSKETLEGKLKKSLQSSLGKDVVQTPKTSCDPYLCYDPANCDSFYRDDEDEYTEEQDAIGSSGEVEWRRNRVFSILGRRPMVGEVDVAVITMFFHFYLHAKFFKVIPLTPEIAELQTRALVRKANMVYSQKSIPKNIGITRFCGCGKWVDPIVTGPNDISMIYANGEDLAAYDLLRKRKRCHKGETRFCEYLNEINMIGKVACFGRFAFVICVICGSRTLWRRESYCDLGPTCGCHSAPIRPPSKYPLSVVALKSQRNMELRRTMLNNGMLLNGWVECCYCKEYITPGKEHSFIVWDDTSYYTRMSDMGNYDDDDDDDDENEGKGLEEEEQEEEEDLERHSKSGHIRKTVVYLCEEHVKYIRWNIQNMNAVYSKRNIFLDIHEKTQRGMKRRMSTRYARAT
jgi:hypothetical protein